MRILMLSDVYFPRVNAVSTLIQTLRQALAEAGHESLLLVPDYPGAATEAGMVGVPGWQIPRDPEDRLMHPRALAAALGSLRPAGFDLVRIHTPFLAHRAGVRWARRQGLRRELERSTHVRGQSFSVSNPASGRRVARGIIAG